MRGLDGKDYKLVLKNRVTPITNTPCSNGHKIARKLLCSLYPFDPIFEEVPIHGCPSMLYLDFLILNRRLVIEVQGIQHREQSQFFGGKQGFASQIKRDNNKRLWCETNNLILVELHDDRTDDWKRQLTEVFKKMD